MNVFFKSTIYYMVLDCSPWQHYVKDSYVKSALWGLVGMTSTFWAMSPSVLTHSDSRDKGGLF